jgi:hypothetical protein
MKRSAVPALAALLAGCGFMSDPATRLDFELERATRKLGREEGARHTHIHTEPSGNGQCAGAYKVQSDKAGVLVVWCLDANGKTVASGLTSHHANYMAAAATFIIDKQAGQPLYIEFERRGGRAVIVGAH